MGRYAYKIRSKANRIYQRCVYCDKQLQSEAWQEHVVGAHPYSPTVRFWCRLVGYDWDRMVA